MATDGVPIRITKERGQAFVEAAEAGIQQWISEVRDNYGMTVTPNGTLEPDPESFALMAEGDQDTAMEIAEQIARARAALSIFCRRYLR
jgi:hypothetical protein